MITALLLKRQPCINECIIIINILLQIFPFSTAIFMDIALRKSRILFLVQWDVFEQPGALPIHTLSKLHYLIHEFYLTNHLSFLELLNCGNHCHPLLSLNPTICHLLNLTSTNLILSPFLLKRPLIFSVFPLSGLGYRPYGLSPALLTKKNYYLVNIYICPFLRRYCILFFSGCWHWFFFVFTLYY